MTCVKKNNNCISLSVYEVLFSLFSTERKGKNLTDCNVDKKKRKLREILTEITFFVIFFCLVHSFNNIRIDFYGAISMKKKKLTISFYWRYNQIIQFLVLLSS